MHQRRSADVKCVLYSGILGGTARMIVRKKFFFAKRERPEDTPRMAGKYIVIPKTDQDSTHFLLLDGTTRLRHLLRANHKQLRNVSPVRSLLARGQSTSDVFPVNLTSMGTDWPLLFSRLFTTLHQQPPQI